MEIFLLRKKSPRNYYSADQKKCKPISLGVNCILAIKHKKTFQTSIAINKFKGLILYTSMCHFNVILSDLNFTHLKLIPKYFNFSSIIKILYNAKENTFSTVSLLIFQRYLPSSSLRRNTLLLQITRV